MIAVCMRVTQNEYGVSAARFSVEDSLEGGVYLFFLIRSIDKKADFYFTVNPYEGYARLLGSALLHPYYNIALRETNDLAHFVSRLAAAREAAASE